MTPIQGHLAFPSALMSRGAFAADPVHQCTAQNLMCSIEHQATLIEHFVAGLLQKLLSPREQSLALIELLSAVSGHQGLRSARDDPAASLICRACALECLHGHVLALHVLFRISRNILTQA